jgi:hypothetical protein
MKRLSFNEFYQECYPPHLKPLFEEYLKVANPHGLMPEIQKLSLAAAFAAGFQAGIETKLGIKS